jgi:hypothetical protein
MFSPRGEIKNGPLQCKKLTTLQKKQFLPWKYFPTFPLPGVRILDLLNFAPFCQASKIFQSKAPFMSWVHMINNLTDHNKLRYQAVKFRPGSGFY